MKIKQRVGAILMALALGTGVAIVQATPAHAAWACNSGYFCIYESQAGNPPSYYWGPNYAPGCYTIGYPWNDRAWSARNRMTSHGNPVTLFEHAGCVSGSHPPINVYWGQSVVFWPAQTYGNVYSSFRVEN